MLEKGQIKVRTDFSFEEKTLSTVTRITGYAIRALMIIALFIGSCLLCTASPVTDNGIKIIIVLRMVGALGYLVSLFFAYRLYRNMKKEK